MGEKKWEVGGVCEPLRWCEAVQGNDEKQKGSGKVMWSVCSEARQWTFSPKVFFDTRGSCQFGTHDPIWMHGHQQLGFITSQPMPDSPASLRGRGLLCLT